MTALTINSSAHRDPFRFAMAFRIRSDRSYVVTTSTPSGRDLFISDRRALTRSMTFRAFSPCRMTTIPPTASPFPFRSATPRRICGPSATVATSRRSTGTPRSFDATTTFSRSAVLCT